MAHNVSCNCDLTDSNGNRFFNSILNQELFLHNFNTKTYVDIYRDYKSNIDLILSTIDICDITNIKVCDETWGSDHYPCFIEIDIKKESYVKNPLTL